MQLHCVTHEFDYHHNDECPYCKIYEYDQMLGYGENPKEAKEFLDDVFDLLDVNNIEDLHTEIETLKEKIEAISDLLE